jgi:hypothetical protein
MSSKITLALAFAIAVLTVLPASIGSSFAQSQNAPYTDCTTFFYGKGPC